MNSRMLLTLASAMALLATAGFASGPASAQTASTTSTVSDKLVDRYSSFAGSTENSAALVKGLRTGSSITLTSTPATGTPPGSGTGSGTETTTFTPPTKPMGYGNVRIALNLAQQRLASQGISNPTPQQLQGALMGSSTTTNGTTTQTQGILQMRAAGMGWGKIANTMGFKLGTVMSGKAPATASTIVTGEGSRYSPAAKTQGSQIVTGASGASRASSAAVGAKQTGAHGSKGIVNASGASVGGNTGAVTSAIGHGSAGNKGIVTGGDGGHGSNAGGVGKR